MKKLLLIILLLGSSPAWAATKLYLFDCGHINFPDVSSFGLSNEETSVRDLFVPCYLIEHDGKRLLWEAGLPISMAGKPLHESQPGMWVEYKKSILDQLADMHITPGDIDFTAYSHFHFDHVGAANAFTQSTLLIQQTEYDAAFLNAKDNPIFDPALYDKLHNSSIQILRGDHDVFGDGAVKIVSAPGHTPGHQVLLLNLENTGALMLSGDLYHFEASRRLKRTPVFNTDAAETISSMAKIEALLSETGATLWIEHNKTLADTLRKAPAYYD
ncbi:MAG: N-acyl homoserine lactonase family protein [Gammaproteobacteria bacterium]|nr:N-acyl homoserine lactonase family protein [Gammaproteobacteria bacterium]